MLIFAGLGVLTTLVRTLVIPLDAQEDLPVMHAGQVAGRVAGAAAFLAIIGWAMRPGRRRAGEFVVLGVAGVAYAAWALWFDRPAAVLMVVPMVLRYWWPLRRTLWVSAGLLVLSLVAYALIPPVASFHTAEDWQGLVQLVVLTLIQGGFAYAAFELTLRRNEERQLLNAALLKLEVSQAQQLERMALEERAHLSRELHDTIGHHMTALHLHAQRAALLAVQADAPAPLQEALGQVQRRGQEVVTGLQEVVRTLRVPQGFSLFAALDALVDQWPGVVRVHLPDAEPAMQPEKRLAVYRCVQEALTNIQKHAPGQTARLHLDVQSGALTLTVRNALGVDGRSGVGGQGLTGLRARVAGLGGQLSAARAEEEFEVCLTLPLP
ncbi:integral membrane sensor signal transduction histidine kinase [Deinococcus maricopensis DSM 21211]|uniref:histidine kinase n=1 Tax=Deinococcus maricopensis (strain DSM 21211 / LMG 22137 / NRRL B-23946 / LB-34) TaxID=709986 RepID=E8U4U8_DEIML|nr:integral membrane sensor signal transduction histidine kinase [Deinococcus maricopensis DSM 21211]